MLRTDALEYNLPSELIATAPADRREEARLLVCSRSGEQVEHRIVRELAGVLRAGDLLVLNASRVVPARLLGVRSDTGGRVQMLYLRGSGVEWEALVRSRRLRVGMPIEISSPEGVWTTGVELVERLGESDTLNPEAGAWRVRSQVSVEQVLERAGRPPLPPYILAARQQRGEGVERADDPERYQTVYAREDGSVAAPTAGLHLTSRLLEELKASGVRSAEVVLHVGTGTFKPVEAEHVEQHPMHTEQCSVGPEVVRAIHHCREAGGRVIAVGTTSARALESYALLAEQGQPLPERMETSILISPGHRWRWVDGLLTNFHLPRSTLLAMVGALFGEDQRGIDRLLRVYAEAIAYRYRFYSYGDAMLVLP